MNWFNIGKKKVPAPKEKPETPPELRLDTPIKAEIARNFYDLPKSLPVVNKTGFTVFNNYKGQTEAEFKQELMKIKNPGLREQVNRDFRQGIIKGTCLKCQTKRAGLLHPRLLVSPIPRGRSIIVMGKCYDPNRPNCRGLGSIIYALDQDD